ncbi:hypothetical protein [Pandoravirus japonicus]|uniref:Uncharacterized protein n=1 Tax=Pandoravirus japonicus TaxID=2823154 RepID=A0A811BQM6_9VIRU|nr:hypothetical protein [Pandoravirus japonicus]
MVSLPFPYFSPDFFFVCPVGVCLFLLFVAPVCPADTPRPRPATGTGGEGESEADTALRAGPRTLFFDPPPKARNQTHRPMGVCMSRNQCQNSTAQIFLADNSHERGSGGLALVVVERNGEKMRRAQRPVANLLSRVFHKYLYACRNLRGAPLPRLMLADG